MARARIPKALEEKLATFPSAIIDTHGKDLTVSADPSRSGTPAPAATPAVPSAQPISVASSSSSTAKPKVQEKAKVNVTSVVVEADFRASADDIFSLLTDEKRIPAWTRASAKVSCVYSMSKASLNNTLV